MQEFFAFSLSIVAGLGLAAACGFRVFVPLLVLSVGARGGMVQLSEGFAWIGSTPALVGFAVATAIEIAAYYVPVVDNFLDSIATPASVVAGIVVSAAVFTHMDPWMRWTLATIAGGSIAAMMQIPTVLARAASTTATGGVANHALATGEAAVASTFSLAAVTWPVVLPLVVLALAYAVYRVFVAFRRRRQFATA